LALALAGTNFARAQGQPTPQTAPPARAAPATTATSQASQPATQPSHFVKESPSDVKPTLGEDWLKTMPWRSIGPANMGGRITAIAISEQDPCMWWIASASGGL